MREAQPPENRPVSEKKQPRPSTEHGPVEAYYNKSHVPTLRCFCRWKSTGQTWVDVAAKFDKHIQEKTLTSAQPCEVNMPSGDAMEENREGQDKKNIQDEPCETGEENKSA